VLCHTIPGGALRSNVLTLQCPWAPQAVRTPKCEMPNGLGSLHSISRVPFFFTCRWPLRHSMKKRLKSLLVNSPGVSTRTFTCAKQTHHQCDYTTWACNHAGLNKFKQGYHRTTSMARHPLIHSILKCILYSFAYFSGAFHLLLQSVQCRYKLLEKILNCTNITLH
jgi:hypothetical protein